MVPSSAGTSILTGHDIQLELKDISQLFHSMDPSPFRERDLDVDAEEFIVAWARELPKSSGFKLIIHLANEPPEQVSETAIKEAVRNYFNYRSEFFVHRDRELLREGVINLGIGLTFLATCLILARYLLAFGDGTMIAILRESLIIGGWVAMWRPMQIFLYDRWPIKKTQKLYSRLGQMDVEVVVQRR
jgi:hypothetical protein